jgi:hypothetical protein
MKQKVKVTVNNPELASVLSVSVGSTVLVETKNGVPVNKEWRNRFKDSLVDKCITISKTKQKEG